MNGTLYGTTFDGGSADGGTLFSISTSGTEQTLHSFGVNSSDGHSPGASLIDVKGTLYGTTQNGGTDCAPVGGCGTVFAFTP